MPSKRQELRAKTLPEGHTISPSSPSPHAQGNAKPAPPKSASVAADKVQAIKGGVVKKYKHKTCIHQKRKSDCAVCQAEIGGVVKKHNKTCIHQKRKSDCAVCQAEIGGVVKKYKHKTCIHQKRKSDCAVCQAEIGGVVRKHKRCIHQKRKADCAVCQAEIGGVARHQEGQHRKIFKRQSGPHTPTKQRFLKTPPVTPAAAAGHAAGGGGDAADGAAGVAVTPKKKRKINKRQSGPHTPTQSRSLKTPPVTPDAAAGHAAGGGGDAADGAVGVYTPNKKKTRSNGASPPMIPDFYSAGMSLQQHMAILQAQSAGAAPGLGLGFRF